VLAVARAGIPSLLDQIACPATAPGRHGAEGLFPNDIGYTAVFRWRTASTGAHARPGRHARRVHRDHGDGRRPEVIDLVADARRSRPAPPPDPPGALSLRRIDQCERWGERERRGELSTTLCTGVDNRHAQHAGCGRGCGSSCAQLLVRDPCAPCARRLYLPTSSRTGRRRATGQAPEAGTARTENVSPSREGQLSRLRVPSQWTGGPCRAGIRS
jgi:hypothetical protein